ncbi:UNVERIFIED_CONTAM: hypothetical protein RF648_19760, partial [Kocuria sp. CPCC 205274]
EPKWKRTNVLNLVNRYLVLKKLAVKNAGMSNQEFVEYLRSVAFEPMLPYLPFDYNPDPEDLELGWQVANDILATRANGVEVHQRVRDSATGEDGSVVVPLSELGHWRAYMQYVYNSTSRWAQRNISDITGEVWSECESLTSLSENQLRELFQRLRDARHPQTNERMDSNIRQLIPNGLTTDLDAWLAAN